MRVLMDVVFALLMLRSFTFLPKPTAEEWNNRDLLTALDKNLPDFEIAILGIIIVIVYWGQNNLLMNNLARTDGKHAVIAVLQVWFLLIYAYFMRLGIDFQGDVASLVFQSGALAIVGFLGIGGWSYAMRSGLLSDAITDTEARVLRWKMATEPVASVFTIPFAFGGSSVWTASWLSLLLFGWFFGRYAKKLDKLEQEASG